MFLLGVGNYPLTTSGPRSDRYDRLSHVRLVVVVEVVVNKRFIGSFPFVSFPGYTLWELCQALFSPRLLRGPKK